MGASPGADGLEERATAAPSPRATAWLAVGAAAGLLLAAWSLITPERPTGAGLPDDVIALVNDVPIRREDYIAVLAGLERDTREPATPEQRELVLDRMIEEELLLQRALELGLARLDRRARADLTSALIMSVVSEAEESAPDEAELRRFYEEQIGFFTSPGRLRLRQVFFRTSTPEREAEARVRADEARRRLLAGEPIAEVQRTLGDREVSPLPDALLPPTKLREYVGPALLRAALELAPGDVSQPLRSGTGLHVLQLVAREPESALPFDQSREQVEAEWRRRAGDRALRRYLDDLRGRAHLVLSEP